MKFIDAKDNNLYMAVGSSIIVISYDSLSRTGDSIDGSIGVIDSRSTNNARILTIAVNESLDYILASYSDKTVRCWSIIRQELLGVSSFKKQATTLECSSFERSFLDNTVLDHDKKALNVLLASDKAGDIYASELPLLTKQVLINRHTASVITDMALCKSNLATSDRDEKVRISHFPDVENIQSYCLGHTSVVSSVCFVPLVNNGSETSLLLSTGWDRKLILWDPLDGTVLCSILCQDNGIEAEMIDSEQVDLAECAVEESDHDDGDIPNKVNITEEQDEADMEDPEAVDAKQYDENKAGRYPSKAIAAVLFSKSVVAVRFKQSSTVKLYVIESNIDCDSRAMYSMRELPGLDLRLRGKPVDITFSCSSQQLIALLPPPIGLQIFQFSPTLQVHEICVNRSIVDRIITCSGTCYFVVIRFRNQ